MMTEITQYPIWETPVVAKVDHRMCDHLVSPIRTREALGVEVLEIRAALPDWSQEIVCFSESGPWHNYAGSNQTEYIFFYTNRFSPDATTGIWIRTPTGKDILVTHDDERGFLMLPPEMPRRWSVAPDECLVALIFTNPPFDPSKMVLV